ncbi:MAG TPA: hypothetical protein VLB68_24785 [Pyrinomonadaceae bacterium]|nr:hypothetical protein [Pyrinomonadaceae bacterium]
MNDSNNQDRSEPLANDPLEARLHENIRAMERRVVRSTRAIIKAGSFLQDVELIRELERDLEWFLTWRLKLADVPTVMWCDGVIDLALHRKGKLTYEIKARAYIGPESDTAATLRTMVGTIVLDETSDRLRSYALNIASEEEAFYISHRI